MRSSLSRFPAACFQLVFSDFGSYNGRVQNRLFGPHEINSHIVCRLQHAGGTGFAERKLIAGKKSEERGESFYNEQVLVGKTAEKTWE